MIITAISHLTITGSVWAHANVLEYVAIMCIYVH